MARARRSARSLARGIPRGEGARWGALGPLIAPPDQQADHGDDERDPEAAIEWPTYGEWAAYYAVVRGEWLVDYRRAAAVRAEFLGDAEPVAEPVAERLYVAFRRGGDAEARRVAGEIADEGRAEILRIYRTVFGSAERKGQQQ